MELALFPTLLQTLIQLELAAGNSVTEVGHSFPAPPAGAYFKLANKVTTRPRDSSGGLDFDERNCSSYSGVFTDAKRFYFVLEPPNPPPPEVDMDAIRKELEVSPLSPQTDIKEKKSTPRMRAKPDQSQPLPSQPAGASPNGLTCTETDSGVTHVLHFQDARPPQEIQFALERDLMVLFAPTMENGKLTMAARPKVNGSEYQVTLHFEAALTDKNCYSLHVKTSWEGQATPQHDYQRKSAAGWFSFWTRDFKGATPPAADADSATRYEKLRDAARQAEAHLDTVPALQQAIVEAMKLGAYFSNSDKEGSTKISWKNGRFVRVREGDDPSYVPYASDAEFLIALRQYYDWETSSNIYPNKAADIDAWRLILRLLRKK